jgi:hypothetical protein
MVRALLQDPVRCPSMQGLPFPLQDLIESPPSASDSVPVVLQAALQSAVYDLEFAGAGGLPKYADWTFQRYLDLPATLPFRELLSVGSPEALVANFATSRFWSAFYRGVSLKVTDAAKGRVSLRISYPASALPVVSRVALASAFRATLVITGAQSAQVTSQHASSRVALFELRW